MENIAIVDAGPLIALFDSSDKYHQNAKGRLEKYRRDVQGKLITTWPIVTEAAYILKEHVHLEAQLDLLKWITVGGLEIFNLRRVLTQYPVDFADSINCHCEQSGNSLAFLKWFPFPSLRAC